jgi:hypothetical protein
VPAGGAPVQDFVLWTPTVGAHTCIRATIEDSPGELSTTNNRAQENVAAFETSTGSPWEPIETKLMVYNPHQDEPTTAQFVVHDVPEGWGIIVDPPELELEPGGSGSVFFAAHPAGPPDIKDERLNEILRKYQPGFIGKPWIEALVPYADTFVPIGGVDVWVHLVERTELDVEARADDKEIHVSGQLRPAVAEAVIAIEAGGLRGKPSIVHAKTNADGVFETRLPAKARVKTIQASFAGDDVYRSAESAVVELGERQIAKV